MPRPPRRRSRPPARERSRSCPYSPDTLDHDFSSAKSHLTGDFLSYYDQFTQQIVAPAAKQKSVKTTAVVLRAALSEFHPDSAVVLLFVNQSTQSKDRPEPTLTHQQCIGHDDESRWEVAHFVVQSGVGPSPMSNGDIHSMVIASDYRVPDPTRVWPLLERKNRPSPTSAPTTFWSTRRRMTTAACW